MRHRTERYTDDDIHEIQLVTLKVAQLESLKHGEFILLASQVEIGATVQLIGEYF
jgi:hypothetical protein